MGNSSNLQVYLQTALDLLLKNRLQAQSALAGSGSAGVAVKYGGPMDVARHVLIDQKGV